MLASSSLKSSYISLPSAGIAGVRSGIEAGAEQYNWPGGAGPVFKQLRTVTRRAQKSESEF